MKRKGVTVIEVLIVLFIVAILVAMLIPAMKRAREVAREEVRKTEQVSEGEQETTEEIRYMSSFELVDAANEHYDLYRQLTAEGEHQEAGKHLEKLGACIKKLKEQR